jgi:SAM-dependent methyltransferase
MDKELWNQRFEADHYVYGKMPNDFLVSVSDQIPAASKVLCIADGEGRNSVFLARLGHQVTAVDGAEVAVRKARALAKENAVAIHHRCEDLECFEFGEAQWDAVVSIFCHLEPELRRTVHGKVAQSLKKGGLFILEAYRPGQIALGTGGPKDPALLMDLDTLVEELPGMKFTAGHETERFIFEGSLHNGPSAVVQLVSRKR